MTSSNGNIFRVTGPFVRGIHRSPVNSPHKGQWRGALMFSLMCARINDWVNTGEAGDLRRHRAHCDVTVMNYLLYVRRINDWVNTGEAGDLRRHRAHCDVTVMNYLLYVRRTPHFCERNPPVACVFPSQWTKTRGFDVNEVLSKQWSCRWVAAPCRWCDVIATRC